MKYSKNHFSIYFGICASILLWSCQKDPIEKHEATSVEQTKPLYDEEDLTTFETEDGKQETGILLNKDMFVPKSQLDQLQNANGLHSKMARNGFYEINTCRPPFIFHGKYRNRKVIYLDARAFSKRGYRYRRLRHAVGRAISWFNSVRSGIYLQQYNSNPKDRKWPFKVKRRLFPDFMGIKGLSYKARKRLARDARRSTIHFRLAKHKNLYGWVKFSSFATGDPQRFVYLNSNKNRGNYSGGITNR